MDGRGRWTAAVIAAVLAGLLAGCSSAPTPWVKPYEREHFADPIMASNRDPVSSIYFEHVWRAARAPAAPPVPSAAAADATDE